jgi:hypothetical protein
MNDEIREDEKDDIEKKEEETVEPPASQKWQQACVKVRTILARQRVSRVALLVLALVLGGMIKFAIAPRVTMGFQDYTLRNKQVYDFDAAGKRLAEQAQTQGTAVPSAGIPTGGSCGGL